MLLAGAVLAETPATPPVTEVPVLVIPTDTDAQGRASVPDTARDDIAAAAHQAYDRGDREEARRFAEAAAQQGSAEAMRLLGALSMGENDLTAVRWFGQAAAAGDGPATLALAHLALESRGGLTPSSADGWFDKARARGVDGALLDHVALLVNGAEGVAPDPARARLLLTRGANEGDVAAMHELALLLRDGAGGAVDIPEAERWLKLAADSGHRVAAFDYGVWLSDSLHGAYRPQEAADYLEKAANAGHGRAAALRGVLAQTGDDGGAGTPGGAVGWWQKGAEAADSLARFYLAIAYAKGEGVSRDYERAFKELVLSEAAGPLDSAAEEAQRSGLMGAFAQDLGPEKADRLRREALGSTGLRLR